MKRLESRISKFSSNSNIFQLSAFLLFQLYFIYLHFDIEIVQVRGIGIITLGKNCPR